MTRLTKICTSFVVVSLMFAGQSYAVDPDSILGIWLLDEGQGDVTEDGSGNGNDGTLMNGPDWVAGQSGGALAFAGSSTYVDCGTAEMLNVDVFSVSFWANFPATQGWNHMVSRGSHMGGGNPGAVNWGVMMVTGEEIFLYELFNNTGWTGIRAPTTAGEWHHVVATFDGTEIQLFHDGALAGTSGGGVLLDESRPLLIGARSHTGPASYFNGSIDEVGYFSAVLSDEDIQAIMNNGLGEFTAGKTAADPQPADRDPDVNRNHGLSWTAGTLAATHNVYFGTS
ncbi:MAG: LamG domain-containing protein, partial [Planctomycetes bacterium]|nr:LamG domain-containing protein [Planctomycetota bacterium]